jgi:hypothetical protein
MTVVPSTRGVMQAWAADDSVEVTRRIEKTIAAFAWILVRI